MQTVQTIAHLRSTVDQWRGRRGQSRTRSRGFAPPAD